MNTLKRPIAGEPLRDPAPDERALAFRLTGVRGLCWVSERPGNERVLIVCPAVGVEGVAIAIDSEGHELWRKRAFYSQLLRAGDGYECQYGAMRPTVRASFDGTWVASVQSSGGGEVAEDLIFDEREAKRLARSLAEKKTLQADSNVSANDDPIWRPTRD